MPPQRRMRPVIIEDVRLLFRNFSGAEGKFNPEGRRTFNIILDDKTAEAMVADGWNVKYLQPREEGDEPQATLQVRVNYKGPRPPKIVLVTSRGKTQLTEDTVNLLDWAEILKADLNIRPYEWAVGDKTGITAYVNSLFVTIREDALEMKYADLPDAPDSAASSLTYEDEG